MILFCFMFLFVFSSSYLVSNVPNNLRVNTNENLYQSDGASLPTTPLAGVNPIDLNTQILEAIALERKISSEHIAQAQEATFRKLMIHKITAIFSYLLQNNRS